MGTLNKVLAVAAAVTLWSLAPAAHASDTMHPTTIEAGRIAGAEPTEQVAVELMPGPSTSFAGARHVGFRFDGSAKAIPSISNNTEFGNAWGGGGKFTLIYPHSHIGLSIGFYALGLSNSPVSSNGYFNIPLEVSYNFDGLFNTGIGGNNLESYIYIGNDIDIFQNLKTNQVKASIGNPTAGIGFRYFFAPNVGINVQFGGRASINGTVSDDNPRTRFQFVPSVGIATRI